MSRREEEELKYQSDSGPRENNGEDGYNGSTNEFENMPDGDSSEKPWHDKADGSKNESGNNPEENSKKKKSLKTMYLMGKRLWVAAKIVGMKLGHVKVACSVRPPAIALVHHAGKRYPYSLWRKMCSKLLVCPQANVSKTLEGAD